MAAMGSVFERMTLANVSTLNWRTKMNCDSFFIDANWYWSAVAVSLSGHGRDLRPIFEWDQPNQTGVLCRLPHSNFASRPVFRPDRYANRRRSSGISTRFAIHRIGASGSQDTRWE